VNVRDLNSFKANSIVDVEALQKAGLVKKVHDGVKILGKGKITVPLRSPFPLPYVSIG
jgi:large subunit ribosomal protein L15